MQSNYTIDSRAELAVPNEESSAIKARSRPRATNKPNEVLLIAPPDTTPSRDHSVTSRDQSALSCDSVMTSRDGMMTSRDGLVMSRESSDLEAKLKRHSLHSSPQVSLNSRLLVLYSTIRLCYLKLAVLSSIQLFKRVYLAQEIQINLSNRGYKF